MNKKNARVLSIGTLGNSEIDIEASDSYPWCDGIYFKPGKTSDKSDIHQGIDKLKINFREYDALLVWHQALPEPLLSIVKRVIKENPSILIIGNSHGYNKSKPELYDLYKLNVPQLYMDYYSMWGPYFTDRYKEVIGINPFKRNILSLGSLRHDFLFKNFKWDRGKTNGKVLMIHEPVSSEGWNDISPEPIGDNRVSESMIEELDRNNIPFDFKVHPNWTDFISNTGDQMWKPHSRVNVVNIPITEMIKYEAVIASWSSIQFEALTMGMPVINVEYKYPTVNDSEWGPGRHGLLKAIKPEDIPHALETVGKSGSVVDMKLLEYFLGEFGKIGDIYHKFIQNNINPADRLKRGFNRFFKRGLNKSKFMLHRIRSSIKK